MIDGEEDNVDDVIGRMFDRGTEGVPTDEDLNIFDSIETLLQDDTAMSFVTNRVNVGMDNERIRGILLPFIKILKSRGVEMFSGGDEARKGIIQAKMDSVNSYAGVVQEFWPLLKNIFEYIKESRGNAQQLDDEDWDDMMFEEGAEPMAGQPQPQQGGQQAIDPNFISPPGQGAQQTAQSYGAGRGGGVQPVKGNDLGLTWEGVLQKHQLKFGSHGLNEVVSDIESKNNVALGLSFDDTAPGQIADDGQSSSQKQIKDGPDLNKMTMRGLVAKHEAKFGSDEGSAKVKKEMENAGLDTQGLDFSPTNTKGQGLDVQPEDDRAIVYDEDDEGDIKMANNRPMDQNTALKRSRMDVMPQSGMGVPNSLYNDDRDDWDDEY